MILLQLVYWGETLWVHESVVKSLSLKEIEKIARAPSNYTQEVPEKGTLVFNIDTGDYTRKKD